ncbi:MAG: protein translocase subunit SecD [Phycisphaerales bacterium]|nr:protein translocase subunit SecD [Phycisphaerales bacterium]
MKNIVWKIVLILAIVAVCIFVLYPPQTKVRLGKDLKGGTSLVYLVNIPDGAGDRQRILAQTIEVLKERVNPTGVLDISMQPLGADRIEIVMPLPSKDVLAAGEAYKGALDQLLKLAKESSERGVEAESVKKTEIELQAARAALEAARDAGATGDELNRLEQTAADAEFAYEAAREALTRMTPDEARLVRTLNLPIERAKPKDDQGTPDVDESTLSEQESAREVALKNLKSEYPHLSDQIDQTVALFDAYKKQKTTLDDPEDLMRLLRGAGVLEYHIAVENSNPEGVDVQDLRNQLRERGAEGVNSSLVKWFPINDLKQWFKDSKELPALEADPETYFGGRFDLVAAKHEGRYYLLLYTTPTKSMTHDAGTKWSVVGTGETIDRLGRPAVSFSLDDSGGLLMSNLTGTHEQRPMAIVLDGQVYSAPNINSQIGKNGVIEGEFSRAEIDYLLRVLAAGTLEARLSDQPIAINTLGPSLGADNLLRGMEAFILSLIVTASIMIGYYFFAGFVANVALLINALIIFGFLAVQQASLTLPGLAGLALSIAMAVDANVLIYERIREEIVNNKEDLRTAIRLGYSRALSAIVDGNLTNLLVCVVLYATATTEVKGFAFTMGWGVVATLFTALFVTRVLFTLYTDFFKVRSLPMLPTALPKIHKMLEPHIDWIGKRWAFFSLSILASIACLALVSWRGVGMLDTEFRGGLAMTMQTRLAREGEPADATEQRLLLKRPEVEAEVREIGERAGPSNPVVYQLRNASVLTVGAMTEDFEASRYQIKVSTPPGAQEDQTITDTVVDALVKQFGDRLDVIPALSFRGSGQAEHAAHTYPIDVPALGANIDRPDITESVPKFLGGVAVVVEDIVPPVTEQSALSRIARLRQQPDFAAARDRDVEVVGLDPADPSDPSKGYRSIAVLVFDSNLNQMVVDVDRWDRELAAREWHLVSTALTRGSSLQEVASYSPAMAKTLASKAGVAVVLSLIGMLMYIWIRFGSLRYSVATVVAVTHNVIICLGALALTHVLAGTALASALMLDEFRIDLNVIAALLTIIGYSLNDTIVILDRIRENRGKRLTVTPEIINNSINQTFSRTVLTGGSTILASIILYVLGGTGIQPFAFTFLIGLLAGTYSSVAIAAPLVAQKPPRPDEQVVGSVRRERLARPGAVPAGA